MLWNSIRESLSQSLPESEFGLWIKPLDCLTEDGMVLELAGPDRFFCAWVEDRYLELMRNCARRLGAEVSFRFRVANTPLRIETEKSGQLRLPGVTPVAQRFRSLHPAYTFDQFMVGESNLLARSACDALSKGDFSFGNCLFMNSGTGLGKSHLTQAVVHQVLASAPSTRLQYVSAQQFSAEMVKNLRASSMEQFSRRFVSDCDMLLVEDIHTLVGKNKTQEELNAILDALINSGRRVILTSAVAPHMLKGLDEDFRSRMTSGLVTQIESPDYETRARIIQHKARVNQLNLSDDVIDLLAQKLRGDIRRTESALIGIRAKSCLHGEKASLALVKEVLKNLIAQEGEVNAQFIRDVVVEQFQVSVDELRSRSRKRAYTFPRQVAMYLSRKYTDQSLADIGALYNRDHSTVLHSIKVITRDMSRKESTRRQVEILCNKLDQD